MVPNEATLAPVKALHAARFRGALVHRKAVEKDPLAARLYWFGTAPTRAVFHTLSES
jgi:hypothetical protein